MCRVTRVECSRRRGCVSQVVGAGGVISTWTSRGLADGKFGGLAGRESVRFDFKCYTQVMSWRDWRKDFGDAAGVQAARQSPRRPPISRCPSPRAGAVPGRSGTATLPYLLQPRRLRWWLARRSPGHCA